MNSNLTRCFGIAWISLSFCQLTIAQNNSSSPATLQVGDTLPNWSLTVRHEGKVKNKSLRSLHHNKILIIDFWATWCSPCLKEINYMDSLLAKDKDIEMLAVAYEEDLVVSNFLKHRPQIKTQNLHLITGDTTLIKWFPHKFLPHNIWIDAHGVIRAITGSDQLNAARLEQFKRGEWDRLEVKKDSTNFQFTKPFQIKENQFLGRSISSKKIEGIGSGVTVEPNKLYRAWNIPIISFYWAAFTNQESSIVNYDLLELQVRDSFRIVGPQANYVAFAKSKYHSANGAGESFRNWFKENAYCYELSLPGAVSPERFRKYMLDDLERYFNLHADIVLREKNCLVVSFDSVRYQHPSKAVKKSYYGNMIYTDNRISIVNDTFARLLVTIGNKFSEDQIIFVNETGIDYPIDLEINSIDKNKDLQVVDVMTALKSTGFVFKTEKRKVPVLLLTELGL